jgi:hypothetical protein
MDQIVDEITQTFEVIEKEELETAEIDDESNNNTPPPPPTHSEEEESTTTGTAAAPEDNNNNGNSKKYTRDELIKLKQSMAEAAPELEDAVKGKTLFNLTPSLLI